MVTVEELVAWLGADGPSDHLLLAELREQGVEYIQTRLGRYFGPQEEVEEHHIGGRRNIRLKEQPAEGEVVVAEYWSGSAWVVVADTEYAVQRLGARKGGRLRHNTTWPHRDIRVTYTRGYAPGAEPADVRAYLYAWISRRWSGVAGASTNSTAGGKIISETIGGYSYRLADGGDEAGMDHLVTRWTSNTFGVA